MPGDGEVISRLESPRDPKGGLVMLRGNLAPLGELLKIAASSRDLNRHKVELWFSTAAPPTSTFAGSPRSSTLAVTVFWYCETRGLSVAQGCQR